MHCINAYRKHRACPLHHMPQLIFVFHLSCSSGSLLKANKQHTPTTWVRRILSPSDISVTGNLKVCCEPRPHYFCRSPQLSLSLESVDGQLQLKSWLKEQQMSVTLRMCNTHSSPWCGGTLINSIPDSCVVFEESQWVVAAIGGRSWKSPTGTHCLHPTRLCYVRRNALCSYRSKLWYVVSKGFL